MNAFQTALVRYWGTGYDWRNVCGFGGVAARTAGTTPPGPQARTRPGARPPRDLRDATSHPHRRTTAATGLVLTGGGARAAYQVGVLKAIARIRRESDAPRVNPFPVITGTSAGAINAAALASGADQFDIAVAELADIWRNIGAEQVYRADALAVIRSGARWLTMLTIGWALTRWWRAKPRSLLDSARSPHCWQARSGSIACPG